MGPETIAFEEELAGRVGLILDDGHSGDAKIFDDAARAAGSLMFSALDAGHHVEWISLGELTLRLVPPFADGQEILDRLARMPLAPGCLTAAQAAALLEGLDWRRVHTGRRPVAPQIAG